MIVDVLVSADSVWNTVFLDGYAFIAPAANMYTEQVLNSIVYGDYWQCAFMPVLPNCETQDDSVLIYIAEDTQKNDPHRWDEFTETPKTPSMGFPKQSLTAANNQRHARIEIQHVIGLIDKMLTTNCTQKNQAWMIKGR